MQMGYVARPDCFRTFGLLGAVSSFSTVHFGSPVPVFVAVHPGGGSPILRLSKLTASANTTATTTATVSVTTAKAFMSISSETKRVLKLRRSAIEARLESGGVQRARPAAIEHDEQVVPGLQDPAKPTLESRNPRFIVVLRQVGPRDVWREVVIR